jgi:putative flippase GtrA
MAIAQNRLMAGVRSWLHSNVGMRFIRFVAVAVASLATSEILLAVCDGVFHLTAVPAALISTLTGAAVSYVLSRWAWERKGKPDLLRETVPFWVISGMVWIILTLATKLGYVMATWLHLHGFRHVALVGTVYFAANCLTFLARFVIFHYVLFTDRTKAVPPLAGEKAVGGQPTAGQDPLRSDDARATTYQGPRA